MILTGSPTRQAAWAGSAGTSEISSDNTAARAGIPQAQNQDQGQFPAENSWQKKPLRALAVAEDAPAGV